MMDYSEEEWKAHHDAEILKQAEEIHTDEPRLEAAKKMLEKEMKAAAKAHMKASERYPYMKDGE